MLLLGIREGSTGQNNREGERKKDETTSMRVKDEEPKGRTTLMALHSVNSEPATATS